MATQNYGRYHTLPRVDYGYIASGQMRGCTYDATTGHLWVHTLGVWGGKHTAGSGSDPDDVTVRIAIYAVDGSGNPSSRLGYSGTMTVTATMNDASGGAANTAAVAASTGPVSTSVPLWSGTRYHLAALGTVGSLGHGMQAAARISATNEKFYNRIGLSQPPPDPFGSYSSSNEGHMVLWAVADENVAPNVPTGLAPVGTINDIAPTFTATFTDTNSSRGDALNRFRVQVRRVSDATVFWDATLTATSGEKSGSAFSRAYAGTTLVRGTAYEWRTQMSDYFDAWSAWTPWTSFTPANLGYVTLDGAPTGKIESNAPSFDGRWTHQAAEKMTRVQVRILTGAGKGGTVLQTGADYDIADVSSSAPPGTSFSVPWASAGLSALPWGGSYQYQIRGMDQSNLWSNWSDPRAFTVNAAPSVPTSLTPSGGVVLTSYPLLSCVASDADDTPGTGLVVYARIKNSGGTVLSTVAMTLNGVTGRWEKQTTGVDIPSYASYRWDAYSHDGTIYSGEASSVAAAAKSPEATFSYALGPTVSVSAPVDSSTVVTAALTVVWTTTDQQKYRVTLTDTGTGSTVYDTGEVNSAAGSHDIPSGILRNGGSYSLVVWVRNTSSLEGTSGAIAFDVAFTPATTVANFTATAVKITTDIWASAIRLAWDQTEYGIEEWQGYTITRQAGGGAPEVIHRSSSPSEVAWMDYAPRSDVEYTYAITQAILTGLDVLASDPAEASATVRLGGVVIHSVTDPDTLRTTLRYTSQRGYDQSWQEMVHVPLSGGAPTTVRGRSRTEEPSFNAQLFDDAGATAATRRVELEQLRTGAGVVCYRDNHGRRLFAVIAKCVITDQVPDWYMATIALREERYSEGGQS